MAHLAAHVRLRPIRFGFLVKPSDSASLLEVFRVNTCLWGGKFNPIIPCLNGVPKWWDRHGLRFESASQIMNGYLDFFEPDFLVESVPGLAAKIEFPPTRVLSLPEMLQRDGDRHKEGHGESVIALYGDRYRKVFQFARRHEHDIVSPSPEDAAFATATACLAGSFPEQADLAYFGRAFAEAFDPKLVSLNGRTLTDLYEGGFTSALRLGHWGIDVDSGGGWHDPALFVFDALEPKDLIDFWNLRAVRPYLLGIPKQWLPDLAAFCRKVITANYRPLPGNPHGVMIRTTAIFGRSIARDVVDALYDDYLRVEAAEALLLQDWYPPLWQRPSAHGPRERRPTLSAARRTSSSSPASQAGELQFDCLHPEWSPDYGSDYRWANVVKIEDWTFQDVSATVFPNGRTQAFLPRLGIGKDHIFSTTEGIIIFPKFKNVPERWELPDGATAIADWLTSRQIGSSASDAGRATEQVVQTLGGFNRVGDLAKKGIIETLTEMSRRPITHSAHYLKFRNQIERAVQGSVWRGRSFETLVKRNAVELGLEVRCEKCSSWSWFALTELSYELQCALCLRSTPFPIADPGKPDSARWAYRVVGPFALPDYARGGYAAALALRCFSEVVGGHMRAQTTWCAGRELTLSAARKIEVDFAMWYQRRALMRDGQDSFTDVVFGEAKSFGRDAFTAENVAGLKAIAQVFPGAILAFATLKQPDELSTTERRAIRSLALWGRERVRGTLATRAPVIVLTGIELFAEFSLENTWKELGGQHAQFSQHAWLRSDNLRVLADVTQQLYLGLPSYSDWHHEKWTAIHARRKARSDSKQAGEDAGPTGE